MTDQTMEAQPKNRDHDDVIWGVGRIVVADYDSRDRAPSWALPGGGRTTDKRTAEYAAQMIDKLTV